MGRLPRDNAAPRPRGAPEPPSAVVLCTGNEAASDAVLSAAAASGLAVRQVPLDDLGLAWAHARVVVVGEDVAPAVVARGLPARGRVYLVAFDEASCRWSAPLGAQVVVLPDVGGWLPGVLTDRDAGDGAEVVSVVGGHGGAGASTLAASLALAAARRGSRAVLVDGDPLGGGLDLLLGAEQTAGWRWQHLASATGQLGEVAGQLPAVDEVRVLSMPRQPSAEVGPGAASAVIAALTAQADVLVVDAGRGGSVVARECLRRSRTVVIVATPDVRSAGAAAATASQPSLERPVLAVRAGRLPLVPPTMLAEHLGLPLAGIIPHERLIERLAQQGEPPGRLAGQRYVRACDRLLSTVLDRSAMGVAP